MINIEYSSKTHFIIIDSLRGGGRGGGVRRGGKIKK
jgi:hypothetical protein